MHLCPGKWVATMCLVVYNAWAAHVFSAVINCRHCFKDLVIESKQEVVIGLTVVSTVNM